MRYVGISGWRSFPWQILGDAYENDANGIRYMVARHDLSVVGVLRASAKQVDGTIVFRGNQAIILCRPSLRENSAS